MKTNEHASLTPPWFATPARAGRYRLTGPWFLALAVLTAGYLGAAPQPVVKSFPATPGGSLVADIEGGDIVVIAGGHDVQVSVAGLPSELADDLVIEQTAGTVRVGFHPSRRARSWSGVRFEFTVPPEFKLDLRTSGGDIRFQGTLTGEIRAKTAGGDFQFDRLAGHTTLTTSGGDIVGGEVGGDIELRTSGGDIRLTDVGGNVTAETSGGDITVRSCTGDLEVKTAGGDIHLGSIAGEVTAQTAGGNISVEHAAKAARLKTAGGNIRVLRADAGLEATTAGGDLQLGAVAGAFSAKTAGGDIFLELAAGAQSGTAKTVGGDVSLAVPPDSRLTIGARIQLQGNPAPDDYTIRCLIPGTSPEISKSPDLISTEIKLNGGGPMVELETANGNITIRPVD
ncbi:MAG TPA: DUF4097 family beta strand repeat-containing protein [Acidobacteriota bacterium]|nr:DUF4097 family beta strand repeat-containing protein [Acidobacteriota bacterium]HRR57368.1 DUF4097 family beta strand repeat-containing protein [Acidobacteriota bacterium]